jgi:hypothetical protein
LPRPFRLRILAAAVTAISAITLTSLGASAAPGRTSAAPPHPIVFTGTYNLLNSPPITVGTPLTGSTGITDQDGNTGTDTWFCLPTLSSPIGVGGKLVDFFCLFVKRLGPAGQNQIQSTGIYSLDLSNPVAPWQNATVPVTGGAGIYCGMSGQSALNHPPGNNTYTWTITYVPLVDCT